MKLEAYLKTVIETVATELHSKEITPVTWNPQEVKLSIKHCIDLIDIKDPQEAINLLAELDPLLNKSIRLAIESGENIIELNSIVLANLLLKNELMKNPSTLMAGVAVYLRTLWNRK